MSMATKDVFLQSLPISLAILGQRFGIKMILGEAPSTNGKIICLGNLDDKMSREEKMAFLGSFVHECAHIAHTNFRMCNFEWDEQKVLCNILEDIRVNRRIASEYPGAKVLLCYSHGKYIPSILKDAQTYSFFEQFCLYQYARLSLANGMAYFNSVAQKFKTLLLERISEPLLEDFSKCCDKANDKDSTTGTLVDESKFVIQRLLEEGLISDVRANPKSKNFSVKVGSSKKRKKKISKKKSRNQDGGIDGLEPVSADEMEEEENTSSEKEKLMAQWTSAPLMPLINLLSKHQSSAPIHRYGMGYDSQMRIRLASLDEPFALPADASPESLLALEERFDEVYEESKSLASRLAMILRRAVEGRGDDDWVSRDGTRLDASRLYRLSNWDLNVFRKKMPDRKGKTTFHVLIDRSGSMDKETFRSAVVSGFALFDAVRTLPDVTPTLSFFPALHRIQPLSLVVPKGKSLLSKKKEIGAHMGPYGFTPTEDAMLSYAISAKGDDAERKILFVISDGFAVIKDLKGLISSVRSTGMEVYGISIGRDFSLGDIEEAYGKGFCATVVEPYEIKEAVLRLSKTMMNA